MRRFRFLTLLATLPLLPACSSSKKTTEPPPDNDGGVVEPTPGMTASASVGPDGGTVEISGGDLRIVVPPGAVTEEVELTIQVLDPASVPEAAGRSGTVYDLGPDGMTFERSVALWIAEDRPATGEKAFVSTLNEASGTWDELSTVYDGGRVYAMTDHFSVFTTQVAPGTQATPMTEVSVSPGRLLDPQPPWPWARRYEVGDRTVNISGRVMPDGEGRWRTFNTPAEGTFTVGSGAFSFDFTMPPLNVAFPTLISPGEGTEFWLDLACGAACGPSPDGGPGPDGGPNPDSGPDGGPGPDGATDGGMPPTGAPDLLFTKFNPANGSIELNAYLDSGNTVLLSVPGDVASFAQSPDGNLVAYGLFDGTVYVVSASGGMSTQISGAEEWDLEPIRWSADSRTITYAANGSSPAAPDRLFVAAADGSRSREIDQGAATGEPLDPRLNTDGSRVAYKQGTALRVAPTDGSSPPVELAPNAAGHAWAPNGSRLLYTDSSSSTPGNLISATPDGSTTVQVATAVSNRVATAASPVFEIAPDSSRVAYYSSQSGAQELYTVRLDGTGDTRVNGALVTDGNVSFGFHSWAPDSSRLAYAADQDTDAIRELYTVLPDGTGNVKVSGPLVAGGDVVAPRLGNLGFNAVFSWSPDSSRLAYVADALTDGVDELFSVVADGSAPAERLNSDLVAGGNVSVQTSRDTGTTRFSSFQWHPNSRCMAYMADQIVAGTRALFLVPLFDASDCPSPGPSALVSGSLPSPLAEPPTQVAPPGFGEPIRFCWTPVTTSRLYGQNSSLFWFALLLGNTITENPDEARCTR